MNKLVSMPQAAALFGFTGSAHEVARKARRRLRAIAENDPTFAFFKPEGAHGWHTTIADLRRVIPELFRHESDTADAVIEAIEDISEKLDRLGARVARVERVQFVNQQGRPQGAQIGNSP